MCVMSCQNCCMTSVNKYVIRDCSMMGGPQDCHPMQDVDDECEYCCNELSGRLTVHLKLLDTSLLGCW